MVETAQISSDVLEAKRKNAEVTLQGISNQQTQKAQHWDEVRETLQTLQGTHQDKLYQLIHSDEAENERQRVVDNKERVEREERNARESRNTRLRILYEAQQNDVLKKIKRELGFFFSRENFIFDREKRDENKRFYEARKLREQTNDASLVDEEAIELERVLGERRDALLQARRELALVSSKEADVRQQLQKATENLETAIANAQEDLAPLEQQLRDAQSEFDVANTAANERWEQFRVQLRSTLLTPRELEQFENDKLIQDARDQRNDQIQTAGVTETQGTVKAKTEQFLDGKHMSERVSFREALELAQTEALTDEDVIGQLSSKLDSIVEYYTHLANLGKERNANRSQVLDVVKEEVSFTVATHLNIKRTQFFQECDETAVEVLQKEFDALQQRLDKHNENKRIGFVEVLETPQALRELKARLKKVETQLKKQLSEQKTNKRRAEAAFAKYLESDELESYQNGLLDNELTMLDQVGEGFQKDWARLSPEELELITSGQLTDVLEYATKMQKNLGKWLEYVQKPNDIAGRIMQQVRMKEWAIEDTQQDIDDLNNELKQVRAGQREKEEEIEALEKIFRRRKRVDKKDPTPKQKEKLNGLNEELEAIKLKIKQLEKDCSDSTQALEQTRKQHARTMQKVRDDAVPDELRFGLPSVQEAQAVSSGLGQFVEMYNAVMFGEHNKVEFPEFQPRFSIGDAKADLRRAMEARKETAEQRDEAIESERNIAKEIGGSVEAAKAQIEASIERILTLSVEQIKEPVGAEMQKVLHDLPLLHNDALLALAERADAGGEQGEQLKRRIIALYEAVAAAADNPMVKKVYETMAKGLA